MDFEIILCCDQEYGIGLNSSLPWRIKDDLKFFSDTTSESDSVIIMGRKTATSLKKQLPNRTNVVISGNNYFDWITFPTLDIALNELNKSGHFNKVFVIGGAQLAEEAIKHRRCRGVYLNTINHDYACDTKLSANFVNSLNSRFVRTLRITTAFCSKLNTPIAITYAKYNYVNRAEIRFLDIIRDIFTTGQIKDTRNALTVSKFFTYLEFDMTEGFPLMTAKQIFIRGVLEELCLFLRGDTNAKHLDDKKVTIWNDNTSQAFLDKCNRTDLQPFDMGPVYGFQWRFFNAGYTNCHEDYSLREEDKGLDQLRDLIDTIAIDPNSRRLLMTTYNPMQAKQGVLYPCHSLITQFGVEHNNRISVIMYQRSADMFLGVPFDIASTSALLHIIVALVNSHPRKISPEPYTCGRVIIIFGDCHIYCDQVKGDHSAAVRELLSRKDKTYPFCDFKILKKLSTLDDLKTLSASDFEITNYICGPIIKAPMVA